MGKQRRKQKRGSKGRNSSNNDRTPTASGQEYNPNSAISRIRHPDHKIRHEALVALQSALLIQSGKTVNMQVIQAVREQVADPNLDCSIAAVQCLESYLISLPEQEEQRNERRDETTATWVRILMDRLSKCMLAIEEGRDVKLWYAVAVPCLRLFCRLCETNEHALSQVNMKKVDFASMMSNFMYIYSQKFSGTDVDANIKKNAEDAAILSARIMHSAVDDNPELAAVLDESLFSLATRLQESSVVPDLALLHFVGCLASVTGMTATTGKCKTLLPRFLGAIQEKFMTFDGAKANSLYQNFLQAKEVWAKQLKDDELEKEIVEQVTERHEPARQIAKRQKADTREHNSQLNQQEDGKILVQNATEEWDAFLAPLQLVLEILTNLTASLIPGDQDEESMDVETRLDSETEGFLRHSSHNIHRPLPDLLSACVSFKRSQAKSQLSEDINELISKISAFAANCVQSNLLRQNAEILPTSLFFLLIKDNLFLEPGVASILAVLTGNDEKVRQALLSEPGLLDSAIQSLLEPGRDPVFLRDFVCMLCNAISRSEMQLPTDVVRKVIAGLLQLLSQGTDPSVGFEILNNFMDIFADDEINNDVFIQLNILQVFKQTISNLDGGMAKDEEIEEILDNAKRFVEYKQSMM